MCGRYSLADAEKTRAALARIGIKIQDEVDLPTRYNVAPTQIMPVVRGGADPTLEAMLWGHEAQFGLSDKPTLLINARSELAAEKKTFKKAVVDRRCIAPAGGFFEWMKTQGGKVRVPFHIHRKDNETFWIAGLYWESTEDRPANYVLLTTSPNELMAPIHDRMPVMMDDTAAQEWLADGSLGAGRMAQLCVSYPAELMQADRVDPIVSNARNDVPQCIMPAKPSSFDEQLLV